MKKKWKSTKALYKVFCYPKIFLIMRITAFLLLFSAGQVMGVNSYSQNTRLSLNLKDVTVENVLDEIENQSEFFFLFNQKLVNVDRKVDIDVKNKRIKDILAGLFTGEDINCLFMDRQILLSPKYMTEKVNVTRDRQPQEIVVTGKVTDEDGNPLPGVNILIKGTITGTITNVDGDYSINVEDPEAVLVFTFIGMLTQEIRVGDQTEINITMAQDVFGLEKVVVIGYGLSKKANLTGAVAAIQSDELEKINRVNSTSLFEGQVAGVFTKQTSGMPGNDDISISIRGFDQPLILIDGSERSANNIDPSMIESISILKDASAAIYGARSGNGVILITTKRGKTNKVPQISYEASYSIQQFAHRPKLITNSGEYTEMWSEAEDNMGLPRTYTDEVIQKYYDGEPGYGSYDWFDYTFLNWAPRLKHNLSLDGGSDKIRYFIGLGFSDQQSVISSEDWYYKRFNIISNVDGNITDNLSFSVDLSYSYEHQSECSGNIWMKYTAVQPMAPTGFPAPDEDKIPVSNLVGSNNQLVASMSKSGGSQDRFPRTLDGKIELDYEMPFIEGLSAKVSMDYRSIVRRNRGSNPTTKMYEQDPSTLEVSQVWETTANGVNIADYMYTRIKPKLELGYRQDFGDHSVHGLLIGEYFEDDANEINASSRYMLSDDLLFLGYGDPAYNTVGQMVEETSRASIAGRINYAYKGKYLVEGTFRYDASSFFPPDTRWGFFPSVSVGWRITEEDFMSNVTWLNNLKLRVSYSETGYDRNAIRYDYFAGYSFFDGERSPYYIFGDSPYSRAVAGTLPNQSMTWETMTNYNIGVDANLWNGLLNVVGEVFYRKRSDILAIPQQSFPSTFGAILSQQNLNSLDDRGIELELSHFNQIGEVRYSIKGIIGYATSKWVHFEEEDYVDEDDIRILQKSGNNRNRSIGYVSDGIFKTQDQIDNYPVDQDQNGNSTIIPGDIIYKDLDGDNVITWEDQEYIGYAGGNPDLNFGLNLGIDYKNFSLSILLQGGSLYSGYIDGDIQTPISGFRCPLELHRDERFHEVNNPDGTLPAFTLSPRNQNTRYSDFWLNNITYLRVENVSLSYNLPKKWLIPVGIKSLRLYMAANNLAVISNLGIYASDMDPEASLSNRNYPAHRTITFGVKVTL